MLGRSVRVVCLAVAAWALLFAPGAAGADATDAPGASRADRVAAAVLAPTFQVDSVARAPRACMDSVEDERVSSDAVSGHVARDEDVVAPDATAATRQHHPSLAESGTRACVSLRGPPKS